MQALKFADSRFKKWTILFALGPFFGALLLGFVFLGTQNALSQTSKKTDDTSLMKAEGSLPEPNEKAPVRMMLKVQIPVQSGNRAIEDGTMGKVFEDLIEMINPEAAYFSQEDGLRTAYFVYVLDQTFKFAEIHEPLIQKLGARVYDQPALTWEDVGEAFSASKNAKK